MTNLRTLIFPDPSYFRSVCESEENIEFELYDEMFMNLTNLTELDIHNPYYVSNNAISKLVNLKTLKIQTYTPYITVSKHGINSLNYLSHLTMKKPHFDEDDDDNVGSLTNLTSLVLKQKGDIGDTLITKLTNLLSLHIAKKPCLMDVTYPFTNIGLQCLTKLTSLGCLNADIDDSGVRPLTNLISLRITADSI